MTRSLVAPLPSLPSIGTLAAMVDWAGHRLPMSAVVPPYSRTPLQSDSWTKFLRLVGLLLLAGGVASSSPSSRVAPPPLHRSVAILATKQARKQGHVKLGGREIRDCTSASDLRGGGTRPVALETTHVGVRGAAWALRALGFVLSCGLVSNEHGIDGFNNFESPVPASSRRFARQSRIERSVAPL